MPYKCESIYFRNVKQYVPKMGSYLSRNCEAIFPNNLKQFFPETGSNMPLKCEAIFFQIWEKICLKNAQLFVPEM